MLRDQLNNKHRFLLIQYCGGIPSLTHCLRRGVMEKCKVFVMIYNSKFHLNVYYFNYIITEIWQMQFLRMAWNETFIHIIYTNNILQQ